MYITILSGDFDRGTRPKPRNVEVNVSVCTEDGKILQVLMNSNRNGSILCRRSSTVIHGAAAMIVSAVEFVVNDINICISSKMKR